MSDIPGSAAPPPLALDARSSWQRFLDVVEPHRPELYRYCRKLTRSPWDAEDLVQDTLTRAFVGLATSFHPPPAPRAWLLRVASNLWIDRMRRLRLERAVEPVPEAAPAADPRDTREAAASLLVRLAPQERAAVLLKDVFDLSLDEVADALGTTTGAVKAALHRGRGRLVEEPSGPSSPRAPAPGVLDAFCAAFNARQLDRLTALLLDGSTVEIVGVVTEYGTEAPGDPHTGSFAGTLAPITMDERGGVPPALLEGYLGTSPRCEVRALGDRWILVFWYDHVEGPMVRTIMTVEPAGDHVGHLRNYFFTPDVIAEVAGELGVPHRINGYRYWDRAEASRSTEKAR